jgi:parallel beta-helix repeat protein
MDFPMTIIKNRKITISICFLLLSCLLCGCVNEDTIEKKLESAVVAAEGDGDFTSIQEAIDNVQIGGTIFVKNGVYSEVLNISKPVSLLGEDKHLTKITCIISNTSVSDSIILIDAGNSSIQGFNITCKYYSSGISGIYVNSSDNLIQNNVINNYHFGINIHSNSKNNSIFGNIVTNSRNGIEVSGSENNNISGNYVHLSSVYGIYLYGANNNYLSSNSVTNNNLGIRLTTSHNNILTENSFTNNTAGLKLCCASRGNIIFNNVFVENQDYNAIDDISNQWDNGEIGNYWYDYLEIYPDVNSSNGIWDQPYNIKDDVYDRFPLVNPPSI